MDFSLKQKWRLKMSMKPQNTKLRTQVQPTRKDDYVVWDGVVSQLGRRVRKTRETWVVQTRIGGKTKRRTLGACGEIKVDAARVLAQAYLDELTKPDSEASGDTTLADFAERFLQDCRGQWKPATLRGHGHNLTGQILPFFGTRRIAGIGRGDVLDWQRGLALSAGTRNRALAVLSSLMRHAELTGLRPPGSNPCAGLRRHKTSFNAQYLDAAGYRKLAIALSEAAEAHPIEVAVIRFLTLTGARRGEVEGLTWSMIDKNRAALPDAKCGPRAIWMGRPVIKLLASLPRTNNHVFASGNIPALRTKVTTLWNGMRGQIGKPKLRLHDLRHSFASVAVNSGLDLQVVGGLLGHSDLGTTAGYAHLDEKRVAAASQRVGKHLDAALAPVKRKHKSKPNIFEVYLKSKLRLITFCDQKQLDPLHFQKELVEWRKSQSKRRAGQ